MISFDAPAAQSRSQARIQYLASLLVADRRRMSNEVDGMPIELVAARRPD
jgi:hypothetical protein